MKIKILAIITAFCVMCFFGGGAMACDKGKNGSKGGASSSTGGDDKAGDTGAIAADNGGNTTERGEGSKWGEDFCDSFADKYIWPEYCGVNDEE